MVEEARKARLDPTCEAHYAQISQSEETPAQKIKRLECELEDERLRNLLLNEVVDIMDAEHGAGLRKKYIAKEQDAFKNKKG